MPAGATEREAAPRLAWFDRSYHPDLENAEEIAAAFTTSPFEVLALMHFCKARTSNLVGSERFLRLARVLVDALLERSELDGDEAWALLARADLMYKIDRERSEQHGSWEEGDRVPIRGG